MALCSISGLWIRTEQGLKGASGGSMSSCFGKGSILTDDVVFIRQLCVIWLRTELKYPPEEDGLRWGHGWKDSSGSWSSFSSGFSWAPALSPEIWHASVSSRRTSSHLSSSVVTAMSSYSCLTSGFSSGSVVLDASGGYSSDTLGNVCISLSLRDKVICIISSSATANWVSFCSGRFVKTGGVSCAGNELFFFGESGSSSPGSLYWKLIIGWESPDMSLSCKNKRWRKYTTPLLEWKYSSCWSNITFSSVDTSSHVRETLSVFMPKHKHFIWPSESRCR